MNEKKAEKINPHRNDHLANERTYLAWIRTSLGIMAFGFVVERFALFLQQMVYFFKKTEVPQAVGASLPSQGYSSLFAIALVAFGALVGLLSFFQYSKTMRQIDEEVYQPTLLLPLMLTAVIVAIGIFLVSYLL